MLYFPGVSESRMKRFDEKENTKVYEASQKQRAKGRAMRKLRRQIEALKAAENADNASEALRQQLKDRRRELGDRYKRLLDDYRAFCKENDLTQALERTYTAKISNKSTKQSGALTNENDPDGTQRDRIAKALYKEIKNRKREFEIAAIAKNTGISETDVDKAFAHVFERQHYSKLFGKVRYFDPDYYMAQSWLRLREGKNILEHDIILIRHEVAEASIMGESLTIPYEDAHKEAEKMYNYQRALYEYLKKNGL